MGLIVGGWKKRDASDRQDKSVAATLTGGAWTHLNLGGDYDAFTGHAPTLFPQHGADSGRCR